MKKILSLVFAIASFTIFHSQYLKLENFNSQTLPSTWTLTSSSTETWGIAHSDVLGSNTAHIEPSNTTQNEKLTTPQVDFYFAQNPVLRFKYTASTSSQFSIVVSYNDGMSTKEMWNLSSVGTVNPTETKNAEIDLSYFQGEYIKVIFLYKGGASVSIDDVSISEPDYEENNDIYCIFNTIPTTEPITYVKVQEIDNRRTNASGHKAHMYFLDQKANVSKSQSYPITLEGDTKGNKVNTFTIFIDWDQDGYFTGEDETYFVGTLTNSTGSDGKQLIGTLNIPSHAKLGETRMRVVKLASTSASFYACGSGTYNGQVHDYTLVINDYEFCNPTFTTVAPITSVKIADLNNTSSSSSTVAVESFKDKTVTLEQGGKELIEVKGNTNGNNTNAVTVFVDWDKNGIFDENEIYEIGKLTNSTGEDNEVVSKLIDIPQNARLGKTTMRVVKTNTENYTSDICSLNNVDGQVEDYSVNVLTGNCIKATTNNSVENGHANIVNSIIANDFKIEANHSFELAQVKFDFLAQSEIDSANITIYEDNNGQPGNNLHC